MQVVIVGSGHIGCGYLVPLFRDAGHHVILGCRTEQTATRVNEARGWSVRTAGTGSVRLVRNVPGVAVGDTAFESAVATADLLVVSVGVGNVDAVGEVLLPGLARRGPAGLDIWVVENGDCADRVAESLRKRAAAGGVRLPPLGVAGAIASVAVSSGSWHESSRPTFLRDQANELLVDRVRLRNVLPQLPGVRSTEQYLAHLHEKLYVFNAGHALTAYLGWLRGHLTVAEAIADPFIRPLVAGALLEARRAVLTAYPALVSGHGGAEEALHAPVAEALRRYGDSGLADPVRRVARQPIRKLAPEDRLLGPVALLRRLDGRVPAHFALGIAAALLYGFGDEAALEADGQARQLRDMLAEQGVDTVLAEICGLPQGDPFAQAVAQRYRGFVFVEDGARFPPAAPEPVLP